MPTNIKLPKRPESLEQEVNNRVIKNVTFFGDSAIAEDDPIFISVFETAKLLAENGYSTVDGGGPGLMKAATEGSRAGGGKTNAVYWEPRLASFFEGKNLANTADETEAQSNYMMRTLGLIEKGDIYVVCKGGTGTISELGMVWALAKLYYGVHKPVILFGDFWESFIEQFQKHMYIDEVELSVLYFAKEPAEVLEIIQKHEEKIDKSKLKHVIGDEAGFLLKPAIKKTVESYDKVAHELYAKYKSQKLIAQAGLDEFASLVHAPARVLDLGCGPGIDASFLSEKFSVTAIDISKRFCEITRMENPNVDVINADIVEYDIGQNRFKGIWARNVLHNILDEDLPGVFKKLADALVEEGVLYVVVREGEGASIETSKKTFGEIEVFVNQFTADKLSNLAMEAGLKIEKIEHQKRSHKWLVGVFRR